MNYRARTHVRAFSCLLASMTILTAGLPLTCSSIPELSPQFRPEGLLKKTVKVQNREFATQYYPGEGALLFTFTAPDLKGDFLIGRPPATPRMDQPHLPEASAVYIRITNLGPEDITFHPGDFELQKGDAKVRSIAPAELVRSYEATSMHGFPLAFRVIPVRPGIFIEGEQPWAKRLRENEDTSSPAQRATVRKERGEELQKRFTSVTLHEGDSVAFALFFPLIPPDGKVPYTLTGGGLVPDFVFHFETESNPKRLKSSESDSFFRAYSLRKRSMENDQEEMFDIHKQLHQHENLREKESSPPAVSPLKGSPSPGSR